MTNSQAASLLQEGIAAVRAGNLEEARKLFRKAIELDAKNPQAWLWLSTVTEGTADKKAYLEEALRLDPSLEEARLALQKIKEQERAFAHDVTGPLYCTVHPDRETMLRCNRCGRPMCVECAVRHPVGMRCRECVQETRSPVYRVAWTQVVLAFVAATAAGVGAAVVYSLVSGLFWLLVFFVAPALGTGVASVVERVVPGKRGRALQLTTVAGLLAGVVLLGLGIGMLAREPLQGLLILANPFTWLYLVLSGGAAVARLR
nr:tetratricopeptide repeat protein [Ardenticatena sp.]